MILGTNRNQQGFLHILNISGGPAIILLHKIFMSVDPTVGCKMSKAHPALLMQSPNMTLQHKQTFESARHKRSWIGFTGEALHPLVFVYFSRPFLQLQLSFALFVLLPIQTETEILPFNLGDIQLEILFSSYVRNLYAS